MKRIASRLVRLAIFGPLVAGIIGGYNERFLMGQVSDFENRQRQFDSIVGHPGSDADRSPLRCSDGGPGTGIYMGHVSGVEGTGAFEDVEVLLTCGNGVLERTVPGPDGGFVFTG
ncbi:MAG: hypothetical protein OXU26_10225, partial [Acidobacteriota bacterium]|nr:hypothetical protein [Acidobacteriota bacterium]MDE2964280.1 hypothetical protein [Acidobacteriota bacterium]